MHRILCGQPASENAQDGIRRLAALEAIPRSRPPAPTEARWPPGKGVTEWLNVVLDVEMRDKVDWRLEDSINRANRDGPSDTREVREMLAVAASSDEQHAQFVALLRDPEHPLSMLVREYIANRFEGQPSHRPRETLDQRRARSVNWRASEDRQRLTELLRELYPHAPQRAAQQRSVPQVADEIAAARWGITESQLKQYLRRPRGRKLNPP
jgi:hypothetical protein